MEINRLIVKTKTQTYSIIIGSGLTKNLNKILRENFINFNKCLLVIDKKVPKIMISRIINNLRGKKTFKYFFNATEKNKNQNNCNKILDILLKQNFSRKDCIISVGGGITGDISAFCASLFKRGLQFINIPTTLLSQVDSSVGGKTGINTKFGKNLIGSFYQPNLVISDIQFLMSLPKREIICGYGEILKHALIYDKNFFNFLEKNFLKILSIKSPYIENTIFKSCKIKKIVVEKDENETDFRKILNFGHTFAHAYEASLNYSKKLNHGEAVILGMKSALRFSNKNKILSLKDYNLIKKHLDYSFLPSNINKFFSKKDINKIISFMMKDKKNDSSKISLVLLKKIGKPIINQKFKKKNIISFFKNELAY